MTNTIDSRAVRYKADISSDLRTISAPTVTSSKVKTRSGTMAPSQSTAPLSRTPPPSPSNTYAQPTIPAEATTSAHTKSPAPITIFARARRCWIDIPVVIAANALLDHRATP